MTTIRTYNRRRARKLKREAVRAKVRFVIEAIMKRMTPLHNTAEDRERFSRAIYQDLARDFRPMVGTIRLTVTIMGAGSRRDEEHGAMAKAVAPFPDPR